MVFSLTSLRNRVHTFLFPAGVNRVVLLIALLVATIVPSIFVALDVYTDVDYHVFAEGAAHWRAGGSPFDRATYRYPPLLALLLIVAETFLGYNAGKYIFVLCDAVVFLQIVALSNKLSPGRAPWAATSAFLTILANPLIHIISLRGNGDIVTCVMVLAALLAFADQRIVKCGAILGLAAYWRVWPIFLCVPTVLAVDGHSAAVLPALRAIYHDLRTKHIKSAFATLRRLITRDRLRFFLAAAGTFLTLTLLSLPVRGYLQEGLLYHAGRRDHRINMAAPSVTATLTHSTDITLRGHGDRVLSVVKVCQLLGLATVTTVPVLRPQSQPSLHIGLLQAFTLVPLVFTAFNSVFTVQYFAWWFAPLGALLACTNTPVAPRIAQLLTDPSACPPTVDGSDLESPVIRPRRVYTGVAVFVTGMVMWLWHGGSLFEGRGVAASLYLVFADCLLMLFGQGLLVVAVGGPAMAPPATPVSTRPTNLTPSPATHARQPSITDSCLLAARDIEAATTAAAAAEAAAAEGRLVATVEAAKARKSVVTFSAEDLKQRSFVISELVANVELYRMRMKELRVFLDAAAQARCSPELRHEITELVHGLSMLDAWEGEFYTRILEAATLARTDQRGADTATFGPAIREYAARLRIYMGHLWLQNLITYVFSGQESHAEPVDVDGFPAPGARSLRARYGPPPRLEAAISAIMREHPTYAPPTSYGNDALHHLASGIQMLSRRLTEVTPVDHPDHVLLEQATHTYETAMAELNRYFRMRQAQDRRADLYAMQGTAAPAELLERPAALLGEGRCRFVRYDVLCGKTVWQIRDPRDLPPRGVTCPANAKDDAYFVALGDAFYVFNKRNYHQYLWVDIASTTTGSSVRGRDRGCVVIVDKAGVADDKVALTLHIATNEGERALCQLTLSAAAAEVVEKCCTGTSVDSPVFTFERGLGKSLPRGVEMSDLAADVPVNE